MRLIVATKFCRSYLFWKQNTIQTTCRSDLSPEFTVDVQSVIFLTGEGMGWLNKCLLLITGGWFIRRGGLSTGFAVDVWYDYRIGATQRTVWIKHEISQTVCYKFVVLDTMWLEHVRMRSNDQMHTKGHQMFVYTMLVGKCSWVAFLAIVQKHDHDIHVILWKLRHQR